MITKDTQSKHWANKDQKIIQSYWDSPPAIKRSEFFVEQLKNYSFNSIFEVGFFSGRNLYYIKEAFPNIKIAGLEINPKAVRYAREKLDLNEELLCMNLYDMDKIKEKFDIVFTSGVAIHISPDNIPSVLQKMLRRSNKYVMHIEECGHGELIKGPKHMNPKKRPSDQLQWAPDLIKEYRHLGYEPKVIELPADVRTNGARGLLIVEK